VLFVSAIDSVVESEDAKDTEVDSEVVTIVLLAVDFGVVVVGAGDEEFNACSFAFQTL
jgi:hypothetical protein